MARRLEYDVTYVRKIEWGERRPSDALRVRLAQVLGVPVSSLPASLPSTTASGLPRPAGPLIGRAEELAAVVELFDGGARLVTILGAPGIGKTRLALAVAAHVDDRLPGGARFVPLVGVTDPAGVSQTIALALGTALPAPGEERQVLADALRSQEMLLVLDNFEHVAPAAPLVGELLGDVPLLRVLVTSRQPLDLRFETQYALSPLAVPDRTEDMPDRLADVAAVALFVARARSAHPHFALDETNAPAVAEICARVQGIPLAIELAAGAARLLTPTALLAQLGHGLDLPVSGPRDAPEHQRTLRAAIGWSFRLLCPAEHIVMRRLAVFAGGCTIETAAAVCRLPDEQTDPRSHLLALAAKSLLEPAPHGPSGARFLALEAVRSFAMEQLVASGELERFQRRHAECFVELAEAWDKRLTGRQQAEALAVLEAEHANLRAAIRWSLEHDPRTATRLCAGLWRFWWIRGHLAEGRHWLAAALALPQTDPAAHALALTGAGVLARTQGAYGPAQELLEQGAALSRSVDDRHGLALALINLGIVSEHQGDHARAWALFQESRSISADIGDLRGVGHSTNCLGTVRLGQGDLEGSAALFEQALSTFHELGDDWSLAMVLGNLGWVAQKQGRTGVARTLYEKGVAMYRTLGDDRGLANMLVNLGTATAGSDGSDVGLGLFEEALLTFSRLGERRGVAECLEALAAARSAEDRPGATVLLSAADALRERIGAPLWAEDQAAQRRLRAAMCEELGGELFEVAWQQGRLLQVDEVVAMALSNGEPPAGGSP